MPWTFQQTVPVAQSMRQKCGSALLDWLCRVPNAIYPTEPQWWEGTAFLCEWSREASGPLCAHMKAALSFSCSLK